MKSAAPVLKTALLLFLLSLAVSGVAFAQRRAKAPQKSASRAAGLVDEANKMAEDRKWPEAIDAYKLAIRLDPNYAPAYGGLGDAYFNGGNWEQALVAYKEQVRLAPNDAQAQYDLGYFYNTAGRHGEAFAPLVKATSLDPTFAEAFYGIGYAYLRGADFEKSISFLKSAIRLKPDYGDAYYGLGQAYGKMGKSELANEQLKKLNTVDPKLARKLEKELQTTTADASTARVVETAPQPHPTVAPQTPPQATEPASRQLQRQPPRVNILRRLSNLSTAVPKDGLLLVSFAGHGMERSGQAFLLPSDAQISDQISFLEETAISMSRVKSWIKETGVGQVVLLLDACRNDPGGRADAPNPLSNAYVNAFNFDVRNKEVQAFATVYATGIGQRAYEYTEKKQGYFSWAVVEGLKGGAANDKGEITLSQLVKYVQDTVPKRLAIDLGSTKQQRPFAIIEGYRAEDLVVAVTNPGALAAQPTLGSPGAVDPTAIEL